jgi:hypothetical protein
MEGTMSMSHIAADRRATQSMSDSFWANFATLTFYEYDDPIALRQLEAKKSDVGLDAAK